MQSLESHVDEKHDVVYISSRWHKVFSFFSFEVCFFLLEVHALFVFNN